MYVHMVCCSLLCDLAVEHCSTTEKKLQDSVAFCVHCHVRVSVFVCANAMRLCVCSNAGKFVNDGGIVDVDISVIDDASTPITSVTSYLIVTVSNTRVASGKLVDVDRLFVPFSSKIVGSGGNSAKAAPQCECHTVFVWMCVCSTVIGCVLCSCGLLERRVSLSSACQ